jgi:hypothetical protein
MIKMRPKDRLFSIPKAILDACGDATGENVLCSQIALTT